jgi:hypothetical protein
MNSIKTRAYYYTVNGTCKDQTKAWLLSEAVQHHLNANHGLIDVKDPHPCSVCSLRAIYYTDRYLCDNCLLTDA